MVGILGRLCKACFHIVTTGRVRPTHRWQDTPQLQVFPPPPPRELLFESAPIPGTELARHIYVNVACNKYARHETRGIYGSIEKSKSINFEEMLQASKSKALMTAG